MFIAKRFKFVQTNEDVMTQIVMKKEFLLSLCLGALSVLGGCSKSPLDLQQVDPSGDLSAIFAGQEFNINFLISATLAQNGFTDRKEDYAVVINDPDRLSEFPYDTGNEITTISWPPIDFDRYTLVLGCFYAADTSYHITRQSITPGIATLRLRLEIEHGGIAYMFAGPQYFAVLYPKLPNRPVTIVRKVREV